MRNFLIRIIWKILCWWQKIARKHGLEEQVEEIDTLKRKLVDYKMRLLDEEVEVYDEMGKS